MDGVRRHPFFDDLHSVSCWLDAEWVIERMKSWRRGGLSWRGVFWCVEGVGVGLRGRERLREGERC
jgi:hypothetical protein